MGEQVLRALSTRSAEFEITAPVGDVNVGCTRGGETLARQRVTVEAASTRDLGELQTKPVNAGG